MPPGLPKAALPTWKWILRTAPAGTGREDLPLLDLMARAKYQIERLGLQPRKGTPAKDWIAAVREARADYRAAADELHARHRPPPDKPPRKRPDLEGKPPAPFARRKSRETVQ